MTAKYVGDLISKALEKSATVLVFYVSHAAESVYQAESFIYDLFGDEKDYTSIDVVGDTLVLSGWFNGSLRKEHINIANITRIKVIEK